MEAATKKSMENFESKLVITLFTYLLFLSLIFYAIFPNLMESRINLPLLQLMKVPRFYNHLLKCRLTG